jgi:hypothetical protein
VALVGKPDPADGSAVVDHTIAVCQLVRDVEGRAE